MVLFLLLALIIPLTFLHLFGHDWLVRNPFNSWILGAIIYVTTGYILSTSPGIIRLSRSVRVVEQRLRQAHFDGSINGAGQR
jgi:hypothetical protein